MEWQPMETAPTNTPVLMGRWRAKYGDDTLRWEEEIGTPWHEYRVLLWRKIDRYNKQFTHWKPLPPPPVQS